ncbi:MAG: hypothetical protein KAS25_02430, partial [Dehalococcoidales bacterium]|nr:hypothetical protein [Dehalococcoidales bacterium]
AFEAAEAAIDVVTEVVEGVDKADKKDKVESADKELKKAGKEPKGKMEARLESLARMYEAKKSQYGKKGTDTEDEDAEKD